jgi:hypothetical protein
LGDKADLLQEKGDKSITLIKIYANAVPNFMEINFLNGTQHRSGIHPFPSIIL